jgi:hypothetical protein
MSVNSYLPHVLVLPEDDANREIANGFLLDTRVNDRKVQVLPVAGGWQKVIDSLVLNHVTDLQKYPCRRIVLLIDFDDDVINRTAYVKSQIPIAFVDRVFVLGVASEPERLQAACRKNREEIGEALADECAANTTVLWSSPLLFHNTGELVRLIDDVKPFLFK